MSGRNMALVSLCWTLLILRKNILVKHWNFMKNLTWTGAEIDYFRFLCSMQAFYLKHTGVPQIFLDEKEIVWGRGIKRKHFNFKNDKQCNFLPLPQKAGDISMRRERHSPMLPCRTWRSMWRLKSTTSHSIWWFWRKTDIHGKACTMTVAEKCTNPMSVWDELCFFLPFGYPLCLTFFLHPLTSPWWFNWVLA